MVRFLALYPPPIDVSAFEHHYFDVHVPLVKRLPGLRRYTVSRNPNGLRGPGPYFLVAALDWDTVAMLREDFDSAAGQEVGRDADHLETLCPGMRTELFELLDL